MTDGVAALGGSAPVPVPGQASGPAAIITGATTSGNTTSITATAPHRGLFAEILDDLNPLQYIPIVGGIYREFTGDQGNADLRFAASLGTSFALGGPLGVAITVGEKLAGIDPEAAILHAARHLLHLGETAHPANNTASASGASASGPSGNGAPGNGASGNGASGSASAAGTPAVSAAGQAGDPVAAAPAAALAASPPGGAQPSLAFNIDSRALTADDLNGLELRRLAGEDPALAQSPGLAQASSPALAPSGPAPSGPASAQAAAAPAQEQPAAPIAAPVAAPIAAPGPAARTLAQTQAQILTRTPTQPAA